MALKHEGCWSPRSNPGDTCSLLDENDGDPATADPATAAPNPNSDLWAVVAALQQDLAALRRSRAAPRRARRFRLPAATERGPGKKECRFRSVPADFG
jgi:hypothetical protein